MTTYQFLSLQVHPVAVLEFCLGLKPPLFFFCCVSRSFVQSLATTKTDQSTKGQIFPVDKKHLWSVSILAVYRYIIFLWALYSLMEITWTSSERLCVCVARDQPLLSFFVMIIWIFDPLLYWIFCYTSQILWFMYSCCYNAATLIQDSLSCLWISEENEDPYSEGHD